MRFATSRGSRPRLRDLVSALHEDGAPAAETWRKVSEAALRLQLPRPSYPHVRRLVASERRRRALLARRAEVLKQAAGAIAAGRMPGYDYTLGELVDVHQALANDGACVSETQAGLERLEAEDDAWELPP